jgi:hypothetical protein
MFIITNVIPLIQLEQTAGGPTFGMNALLRFGNGFPCRGKKNFVKLEI